MPLFGNEKLMDRIRENFIRVNEHWIVPKYSNGYGRLFAEGKNYQAHRLSYEVFVGPIPDGLFLDHLCRVTNCINPDHLEPVTPAENNKRGNGASGINARKTHCKRGHPLSGDNLYFYGDRKARQCRRCHANREVIRREIRLATVIA